MPPSGPNSVSCPLQGPLLLLTGLYSPTGSALNDSPAGLAAYILEKFSSWTNTEFRNLEDGGLNR